jgi:hypothetical protein
MHSLCEHERALEVESQESMEIPRDPFDEEKKTVHFETVSLLVKHLKACESGD